MCPVCNKPLGGKQRYCSGACKTKASRNRTVTPTVTEEHQSVTLETPNVTNVTVTNRNSRGDIIPTTQAEIEAYYTKENFPSLSYGPTGSPNPPHMRGSRATVID